MRIVTVEYTSRRMVWESTTIEIEVPDDPEYQDDEALVTFIDEYMENWDSSGTIFNEVESEWQDFDWEIVDDTNDEHDGEYS